MFYKLNLKHDISFYLIISNAVFLSGYVYWPRFRVETALFTCYFFPQQLIIISSKSYLSALYANFLRLFTFPYIVLNLEAISIRCALLLLVMISIIASSSEPNPLNAVLRAFESSSALKFAAGRTVG